MIKISNRSKLIAAAIALLMVGGGVGAAVTHEFAPTRVMAPGAPIKIAALSSFAAQNFGEPIATISGKVSEVYGESFVVDDGSGKMLVKAGRRGMPIAIGQTLSAQGEVENGTLDARYLVGQDGVAYAVGRHHGGGHGKHRGDGRGEDHGFERQSPPPAPAVEAPAKR